MKLAIVAALLAALATISLVVQPGHAVNCAQVVSSVAPCLNYLRGREANPNALCCGGVRAIKGMCQTTADKRTACSCLQRAAAGETDLKDAAAQSLGPKCNVQLDVPISKTVDCARLTFPQFNSWSEWSEQSEESEQAVTCGQVYGSMKPCMDYLSGKVATPAPACCAGVRAVKGMAQTTEDKIATCSCLKQAAQSIEDLKDSVAQNLPTTCNVQLDVPISRTVDCTKLTSPWNDYACAPVDTSMAPCLNFLRGHENTPSEACCKGVQAVKGIAQKSLTDKRGACSCLKKAAIQYADLKDSAAQALPTQCNVQLDVPISRTVQCESLTYYA